MTRESIRDKIALARQTRPVPPPAPPVEDGECWAPDEDYGLQGGQGRDLDDMRAAAGIMYAVGAMLGLAVVAGVAFWALAQLAGVR